jgi:hypothetical protein
MSALQRRWLGANERYNRLLHLSEFNPLTYGYERDIQDEFGMYIDRFQKNDFLTQISIIANQRLLTHAIRTEKGMVYGQTLTLTVGVPVRIDFLDPSQSTNLPSPLAISPHQALFGFSLTNQGNGHLLWSANAQDNGSVLLLANAPTIRYHKQVETYETLTLQAIGSNCTVNVGIEI